jgi:hypothetical protein
MDSFETTVFIWDDINDIGEPTSLYPNGKPLFSYMYIGQRKTKPAGYPDHAPPEVMLNGKWIFVDNSAGNDLSEIGGKVPKGFIKYMKGSPEYEQMMHSF